jgi:hypothetical protein
MAKIHTDKWSVKDRGIGDTIHRITSATGIKSVVNKISEIAGEDCGCEKRRERLNNPDILVNRIFYKNKKNKNANK